MVDTKRAIGRIEKLLKVPVLMPNSGDRCAVNKHIIYNVVEYIDHNTLRQIVNNKLNANILVMGQCKSIHVRITDGWFSLDRIAEYFEFKIDDFILSEQAKNLTDTFGAVISSFQPALSKTSTYWCHPVVLIPILMWIDKTAATELMAIFFLDVQMPNVDVMKSLMEKRKSADKDSVVDDDSMIEAAVAALNNEENPAE